MPDNSEVIVYLRTARERLLTHAGRRSMPLQNVLLLYKSEPIALYFEPGISRKPQTGVGSPCCVWPRDRQKLRSTSQRLFDWSLMQQRQDVPTKDGQASKLGISGHWAKMNL